MIATADQPGSFQAQPGSQDQFLGCPVFETLIEGNRGGGKSVVLLMDFAQHCGPVRYEGHKAGFGRAWRGIIFRRHIDDMKSLIAESWRWFPHMFPGAIFTGGNQPQWLWSTGEILMFRSLLHAKDAMKYQGSQIPWIGFEELTQMTDETLFKQVIVCCRSSTIGLPCKIRATANPSGPGHGWVKLRYELPALPGRMFNNVITMPGEKPRVSIRSHLDENKALLAANPDYADVIRTGAKDAAQLQAWLYGDWDIVSGGMFSDVWNATRHIIPNFDVPVSWRIDRSFDWGSSAPFSVGWWAESDGSDMKGPGGKWYSTVRGDLFRIAEWYGWSGKPNEGSRMLAEDVAEGIVKRELAWGIHNRVKPGPADNQIWNVESGECIAHKMAKPVRIGNLVYPGVQWARSDKRPGSRKTGWELFRTVLSNTGRTWDGPREKAGLYVCQRCDQFLRTIPTLPRDLDFDPDDVHKSAEDHIADEVRYRLRYQTQRVGSSRVRGVPS